MKILILGGGGREHALAWNIKERGNGRHELFIAPGNPGTAQCGTNINIAITDFEGLGRFCLDNTIEMVIAGPEEPLVKGAWDHFQQEALRHIHFIGPSQLGAQLEGSKAFAKAFMQRHHIPTAAYREFTAEQFEEGVNYLQQHSLPIVLKADGLAAGKGVVICATHAEAIIEFEAMLVQAKFGDASKTVVVEQFLDGIEMSIFILTDGKDYVLLPEAKDYKRIGEKDTGLNTGGMGAVSPVPFATGDFMQKVATQIIEPTVKGLDKEGIDYTGFVFIGLIKVNNEPFVIEYNCRMGDPETEVVMPRLKNDLANLCLAAAEHRLAGIHIETDPRTAVTVVAVSGGYPGSFEKGYKIEGLSDVPAETIVFQAGTKEKDGQIVTNGGRVLCATSFGANTSEAVAQSRQVLSHIRFDDMYYRGDIGYEFE
ncbi:phosphoribosylamine--glycine ligase [Niabella yanshanensis]|uniref:Phosphoribosylamine--glycine ligase n=1 Tax=Niabella yanshanensis TaxID=577386 RepID=A0ABZ0W3K9_9BACT|nr:phosphoribosylamine--glycine ligase [Niabella yanshanensis]WQD37309.1 phosphoribosylamine--glycine ligase [Niabella yanshanensis]